MVILIIEDELLIQKSLKKILESRGHFVDACNTGKEALSLIEKNKYDRIVCDLMLQDTTGIDIIEDSKRFLNLNEISKTFVLMTAYSSAQVVSKAQSYGCDFLRKPFDSILSAIQIITNKQSEQTIE